MFATFTTNIVFLNMLIAIMQNTFEKITEKKERNGNIKQTELYADFITNLKVDSEIDRSRYIYIIDPTDKEHYHEQEDDETSAGARILERIKDMEARQHMKQKAESRQVRFELKAISSSVSTMVENRRRMTALLNANIMPKKFNEDKKKFKKQFSYLN